jgi:hypothetical protein
MMTSHASSMRRDAVSLLQEEKAASAYVLVVLNALSDEDFMMLCRNRRLSDQALDATSKKVGLSPVMVRRVIIRYVLTGLDDSSDHYRVARERFEHNPSSITEVRSVFEKYGRDRIFFLLHTELSMWQGTQRALESLIVEDGHLASLCAGYLVKENRTFPNVIQLLSTSRREAWPNWAALWGYF